MNRLRPIFISALIAVSAVLAAGLILLVRADQQVDQSA